MVQKIIAPAIVAGTVIAAATTSHAQELTLSPALPVINRPFKIFVPEKSTWKNARFELRHEATGEVISVENSKLLDHGIGCEFTPIKTGYYIVTAQNLDTPSEKNSLRFPVVVRDLQFLAWPPLTAEESHLRALSSHVIVPGAAQKPEEVAFWRARGSKVLAGSFTGSRQIDLKNDAQANVEKLVRAWESSGVNNSDGVYIDELGAYPNEDGHAKTRIMNEALNRFREQNPKKLIFAAVAGAILPEQASGLRSAQATGLLEIYEPWAVAAFGTHRYYDYIDQRIQIARHTDLIYQRNSQNSAIIFLGAEGFHGGVTKPQLEDAVRYVRKQAPEMPGIAFYASGKTLKWLQDTHMRSFMEELCERYYIKPVLEVNGLWVNHAQLQAKQSTKVQVRIDNLGGMEARQVRVNVYATHLNTNKKEKIGVLTFDKVGVGFSEIVDKSLNDTQYKTEVIDGREVPIFNVPGYIFHDRTLGDISWTPKQSGSYTLEAIIEPSHQFTVLEALASKDVTVIG
jgi:hypothetical protein